MATIEELSAALVKADAAGNAADAKALADAIRAMQGKSSVAAPVRETFGESLGGQAISGLNEGIGNTLGAPVDILTAILNAGGAGINAVAGTKIPAIEKPFLGSAQINELMGTVGAIKPQSEDAGKQFIRRLMQDVGGASVPVLGTVGKAARPIATAAKELTMAAGAGAGAATAQQAFPGNPWAELVGQLFGAGTVAGVTGAAKKAITPNPSSPERQTAAAAMKKEGVELTAGQQTGNKGLQYAESTLGGGKIADITESQAEQFTRAALKRAGIGAKRATVEVMDDAFTRIGQEFDGLASRNAIIADQQMVGDIRDVWTDYTNLTNQTARAPIVENTIRDISDAIRKNGGSISGEAYKAIRSRIERAARGTKDPELADALRGIKGALDDAMERAIGAYNPDDLGAWQQVRSDYRNMLVIEKAAQTGGEASALGLISPAQLRMGAQQVYGKRSYVRGRDAFAELAQAGQATMSPLPQSGTQPRLSAKARNLVNPLAWVDAGVGRAILSEPGKRYLANQVLKKGDGRKGGVGPASAIVSDQTSGEKGLTAAQKKFLDQIMPQGKQMLEITVPYGN